MNDLVVTEGNDSVLSLVADGSPTPTIEWFRNDVKVKTDKRIVAKTDDKTYSLNIIGTKAADQGEYKAIIKNKMGQVESRKAALCVSGTINILLFLEEEKKIIYKN